MQKIILAIWWKPTKLFRQTFQTKYYVIYGLHPHVVVVRTAPAIKWCKCEPQRYSFPLGTHYVYVNKATITSTKLFVFAVGSFEIQGKNTKRDITDGADNKKILVEKAPCMST